jgi:hypothetical protein
VVKTTQRESARPRLLGRVAVAIGMLIAIVLAFATMRVNVDWPSILAEWQTLVGSCWRLAMVTG